MNLIYLRPTACAMGFSNLSVKALIVLNKKHMKYVNKNISDAVCLGKPYASLSFLHLPHYLCHLT